jgi:hypothetical protein
MNKYLKEEKQKRLKFEFIKNPSQILIKEIQNKKRKIKMKDNDFNNLLAEDNMDFDTHKYLLNNKRKMKKEYKSVDKNLFKYLFLNQNKANKENKKSNKQNKKKIILKSFSQNLQPSIMNFHNKKVLKFPQILKEKKVKINNNYNNLLIKANEGLNIIQNNSFCNEDKKDFNIISEPLSFKEMYKNKKLKIKKKDDLNDLNLYTNFSHKTINSYNRKNYYMKLNSLTDKSKEILKQLNCYSTKQNFYINKEKEKTNLLNNKYNIVKKVNLSDL